MPCGGGVLNTTRSCDSPAPSCGGDNCTGIDFEQLSCNEEPCQSEHTYMYVASYT